MSIIDTIRQKISQEEKLSGISKDHEISKEMLDRLDQKIGSVGGGGTWCSAYWGSGTCGSSS